MVQAAKVSGSYVETTEVDVALVKKLASLGEGRLDELSDQEIGQFLVAFEKLAGWSQARIEAERRKQGIIEATSHTPNRRNLTAREFQA